MLIISNKMKNLRFKLTRNMRNHRKLKKYLKLTVGWDSLDLQKFRLLNFWYCCVQDFWKKSCYEELKPTGVDRKIN